MASFLEEFNTLMKAMLPSLNLSEDDQCFILGELNKPVVEKQNPYSSEHVWVVRTGSDLLLLRDKLAGFDIVAIDIETSSIKPKEGLIVGVGLGVEGLVAYIPIAHTDPEDGSLLPDQLSLFEVVGVLDLKNKKFVAHNAKFEFSWLKFHAGINLHFDWDTLLAAKLLQSNIPVGLEELAIRELDVESWSLSSESMKAFQSVDLDVASNYCGKDVLYTFRISQAQKKAMAAL